ncbi:MAG: penicillin-binding protein 2 [Acetobacteraceae bacterium]|nr:penicillin-binding protein 2 [Acetobacteraceae bacterium]
MKREVERTGIFTRRALMIGGVQIAALGVLAAKLYRVQVVEGDRYATLADSNRISARLLAPPRGRLLDRTGTVVAGNRLNWRALLVAEQSGDVAATLDRFAAIVPFADHDRARVERELRRHRRFIPIILREFLTWQEMARVEVHAPDLPGVLVDVGTTREYLFGSSLAHIVGYVAPPAEQDASDDPVLALPGMRVGRAGMERRHDAVLRGRAGAVQLEVNAHGRVIRELERHEGIQGQDVTLTIDAALQRAVLGRLGEESASAVVLDIRNGDVLAMASNPSFDPSVFNSGVSQAQWVEWTSNRRAPLINKAVAGLYSPGSTYKCVVALAALDAKVMSVGETVNCPGYLDYGDRRYHCWSKGGHGNVDMRQAIKVSCDIYFFESARRMGIDRLAAMSNRFGIGVDLGSDLPGARKGLMPTRAWAAGRGEAWNIGDTIVCGIGQGRVQTTPLALATMAARIASGRMVVPRLTAGPAVVAESLGVPERGLALVRDGMWSVVNEQAGSAPLARLGPLVSPNFATAQMAGKTGSVQIRNVTREQREKGYKSENLAWEFRPHALFIAYAPHDAPRYAMALVVEHGNAGAQAAAPIAREIMIDTLLRDPGGQQTPRVQARS